MDNGRDFRSFWSLLENFQIEIPLLQRDYVQGLQQTKNNTVRKGLLDSISECLEQGKQLSFDFIYGAEKKCEDNTIFLPLDGQQRLTTLFLLHWYFAVKEGLILDQTIKDKLIKFSYLSRISSREFCKKLVSCDFKLPNTTDFMSVAIQQTTWFHKQWDFDPTVKAMLVMLDDIHTRLKDLPPVFDKFTSSEIYTIPIVFHCITLEKLNLTDRIYIKMNARGKTLSAFESFKAWTLQTLKDHEFKEELKIFRANIEIKWTNIFWQYKDPGIFNIDKPFMRYINFISEMLLRIENHTDANDQVYVEATETINYDLLENLFVQKEKIRFLFDSISLLSDNESAFSIELGNVFCSESSQLNKLKIFSNQTPNLMERLLGPKQNLQNDEKTLLYCAILRKMKYPEEPVSLDYLRILRNLISRIRQQYFDRFVTNYRAENFYTIINLATQLLENADPYSQLLSMQDEKFPVITPESFKEEVRKAKFLEQDAKKYTPLIHKLEDMDIFSGTLNNILDMVEEYPENLLMFFDTIFQKSEVSSKLTARGLLALGCDAILLPVGWTLFGPRYVIRGKNGWYNFLTTQDAIIQPYLKQLHYHYTNNSNSTYGMFEKIIEERLVDGIDTSRAYYFIKYPVALEESDKFVLSIEGTLNFEQFHLMSGKNLVAWHAFLMHFILEKELYPDKEITSFSYGTERNEFIKIKNGSSLQIKDKGWKVFWPDIIEEPQKIALRKQVGIDQNDFLIAPIDEDVVIAGKKLYKKLEAINFPI